MMNTTIETINTDCELTQSRKLINFDPAPLIRADKIPKMSRINHIVKAIRSETILIADNTAIFIWDTKLYKKLCLDQFAQEFEKIFGMYYEDYKPAYSEQAYEQLRQGAYLESFNQPYFIIPFKNGLYNLQTNQLETPDSKYHFVSTLDCEYSLDTPYIFLKALREILPLENSRIKVLKFIKYALSTPYLTNQFAQLWHGKGNNGKSALLFFFLQIFGDLGTTFDLNKLNADSGYITVIKYARLVACSEVGGDKLSQSAQNTIKRIITEPRLDGRGAYEKASRWENQAKFILATNDIPDLSNKNDAAFFRRWQIIEFTEDFTGKEDKTLFTRIYDQERGAVISYILREINTDDMNADDKDYVKDWWLTECNMIRQFVNSASGIFTTEVKTNEYYDRYIDYCRSKNEEPFTRDVFANHLLKMGFKKHPAQDLSTWYYTYK